MARASGVGDSGSCNIDAACDASWKNRSNAVAKMIYTSGAYSYLCSGTLLNDATSSRTPYFLTANHCISSQSVASTLNTYWFYRSSSCNSGQLSPVYQALSTGATLLYHGSDTDSSFLRLNSTPPGGVTYSGWTTVAPTKTIAATGLHHPKGDLLKISYGSITDFLNCTTPNLDGSFNCSSSVTGNYVDIRYTSGTTEGGSSGSGIFLNDSQHLFGQLYGGNSTCSNLSGSNIYGRFDRAYSVGNLGQWLNASGTTSIIRTGSGTIRSAPEGINCGSVCAHDFTQGSKVTLVAIPQPGRRFLGWSGACTGKIAACILRVNGPLNVQANFSP